MSELPITIREMREGDRNLVFSSWLKSNATSATARVAGHTAYYSGQHALIERLMQAGTVRVVCSQASPDTIVGWASMEPGVVHYVWVREEFRRAGVAKMLLSACGPRVEYTHRTDLCRELPIPEGWWFNLYRLMVK